MVLQWEQTVVDSHDPQGIGRWWVEALRLIVVNDDPDEFEIRSSPDSLPGLVFVSVPDKKLAKNRLHFDFRPDDQAAEVARLERLGARRVDIGQGEDVTWIVLADPEGNEFCVLCSRLPES
jgi:hypothetical protein